MMKALLLHVGADHSTKNAMTLGVSGPIFQNDNNTFEFIPVLEFDENENAYFLKKEGRYIVINGGEECDKEAYTEESRTYSELPARNIQFGKRLSEYLPIEYANAVIHSDPDFADFTYGDSINTPKGMQIRNLKENDYIFFVSSLAPYVKEAYDGRDKRRICSYQKANMAKYVVGYFRVQDVFSAGKVSGDPKPYLFDPFDQTGKFAESKTDKVDLETLKRIKNNAHSKRGNDDYFIVVGHPSESALLTRAVKLTENGWPFKPAKIGFETYGDVGFPRGFKWIYDQERIQGLLNYCRSAN